MAFFFSLLLFAAAEMQLAGIHLGCIFFFSAVFGFCFVAILLKDGPGYYFLFGGE